MNSTPMARRADIIVSETQEETIVYDLKTNKVYCLNDTCRRVWNLCDGTRTVEQIGIDIDGKESGKQLAEIALTQLDRSGLLEANGFQSPRTSRREMMRILGTAGAISLPLITALVAPRAAQAQSTSCTGVSCPGDVALNGCCTIPGDVCCGGTSCCGSIVQCCGPSCCEVTDTCCGGNTCCLSDEVCTGGVCVPA